MIKPPRIKTGDAVALLTPAGEASPHQLAQAKARVNALGLEVAYISPRRQLGYLAGSVEARVEELNRAIVSPEIKAIIMVRGGFGSMALLPHLDYAGLRQNPKVILGMSDITALLTTISLQSELVTFHGPNASSQWPEYTVDYMRRILFAGEACCLSNPIQQTHDIVQREYRTHTIAPGQAEGILWGGNLTLMTALLGTNYSRSDWSHTILFLEDTQEEIYRIERMLLQLSLAGILPQLAGIVFGQFTHCPCSTRGHFYLTDVIRRMLIPLGIPSYFGAAFGHVPYQYTLPLGIGVRLDADACMIELLESPVN